MGKFKKYINKKRDTKEINVLYKEDRKMEKEMKKQSKNYPNIKKENIESEVFVDTTKISRFDTTEQQIENNEYNENEKSQTLVLDVSSKDIRKIKHKNQFKRKADEYKDLQNTDDNIIEVIDVSKDYISGNKKVTKVLTNLNLTIKRGDFVVLYGKSGSGKSTLLNIISGLDRPTEGQVVVENKNLPYLSNGELTSFRRDHIAFIFQQYHLLNNITGYENVETGAILQKDKHHKLDIKKMFEEFDLLDVMDKYPSQMSGGQQQRISILRALAKNADIIFADEPTGALDKRTSDSVMTLLKKINEEQGKTIIMVSHDPDVTKYAKRIVYLNRGKIVQDDRI